MKNILITGGAGFVGSNIAVFLKKRLGKTQIICFDNLIRAGSALNQERLQKYGIKFIKGDIRHKNKLFSLQKVDTIIECSAEPSVLASYQNPEYTIQTNLIGTINCLELAKRDKAAFIFLSTSRVYPVQAINELPFVDLPSRFEWNAKKPHHGFSFQGINEHFNLNGVKSLYGATKLASEQLMLEYLDMYGLKGVINRFGVIAGPWQMGKVDQGIVGFWVCQHKFNQPLNYIGFGGTGKQVRDVLHVDDVCELIFRQLKNLNRVNGMIFNVGGGNKNSVSLKELTRITQQITKQKININSVKTNRKADIRIYITDNTLVRKTLDWSPTKNLDTIVFDINVWIDQHKKILEPVMRK